MGQLCRGGLAIRDSVWGMRRRQGTAGFTGEAGRMVGGAPGGMPPNFGFSAFLVFLVLTGGGEGCTLYELARRRWRRASGGGVGSLTAE